MIFTTDVEVVKTGAEYARPVAFSTFLTSFSFIIAMALRTVEKARIQCMLVLSLFDQYGGKLHSNFLVLARLNL